MSQLELLGTTLLDHVHKGPNQAGNKSMLAYNSLVGIPGYTGYISAGATVQVPIKGFEHTGRPASTKATEQLTVNTVDPRKATTYGDDFRKVPSDTQLPTKTGGGYWIADRKLPAAMPFTSTSTYRAELLRGGETAAAQLERSNGLACTLVGYEAARQHAGEVRRSISAEPRSRADATVRGIGTQTVLRPGSSGSILDSQRRAMAAAAVTAAAAAGTSAQAASTVMCSPERRPATMPTTAGELPGYQTTYGIMNDKVARNTTETLLAGPRDPQMGDPRFKVLPRVMNPGMSRTYSTYGADYGTEGHDPMTRQAPDKTVMTRLSTTRDLAHGTTRNVCHIPRYTGHIPASAYATPEGAVQGEAAETRPDHKARSLPFQLDQYPRGRLPGYTGFKPQAPRNVGNNHTVRIPSAVTATGEQGLAVVDGDTLQQERAHNINSNAGLMTFFTNSFTGTEFVSDNGLANAHLYYRQAKSQGKLGIRTSQPSKITVYGAPFRPAASMV
ncbi:hypothetical protein VOLCADRAFT_107047 [Volvox carteri f. nagariensis]|uniref:Flagellar associated protein n=1 Tax=Volvox carteri f. nagariensis TaxID=3068 RepID=D8UBL7_VOLCA|nr:uncharacterized protein VOLCADRAFT_107047 [Volvox carteri f. nagariensis]EFJ42844.1 hypothetical protein VOLCADRAFT_107047 [Volvox carteri f. nagariensis]|eukprot:XP_002956104.1 hypothetical protein VOLCADRAFT_107047 [Volvox carteri f. nagariensis]